MTLPLLATKLYVPKPRPGLMSRERLLTELGDWLHPECRLVLISAPAGFGKTTLLSQWAADSDWPTAWVSLDESDNDPARFWSYFISAIQTIYPEVGQVALAGLLSPHPPAAAAFLPSLVNELTALPDPLALVLDDFHIIDDPQIKQDVFFFVENAPPQVRLVLSTRADPPWALARMRARREVVELRTGDLRLSPDEVEVFTNKIMDLGLSADDISALDSRTEGWITGLQLAAISMRGRADSAAFISAFSGSHRFILDYLMEEVFGRQSQEVQSFLLTTSVLQYLNGSLCDAVTGRDDSEAVLAQLDQDNLFLVPLDEERKWYRYHHLFADLLRTWIQRDSPDQVSDVHLRASEWYEQEGLFVEALRYALKARDVERAERLVGRNVFAAAYQTGVTTLAKWFESLDDDLVYSYPWLSVTHAWVLTLAGRLNEAESWLQGRDWKVAGSAGDAVAGHVAAVNSYVHGLREEIAEAAMHARQALKYLPEDDYSARAVSAMILGCALRSSGDFAAASQAFDQAIDLARVEDEVYIAVDALWEHASLQMSLGQLGQVMNLCQEALRLADEYTRRTGQLLAVTGYTHTLMSSVHHEWNNLDDALSHGWQGFRLCEQWGQADAKVMNSIQLAGALQASGDFQQALDVVRQTKEVARGLGPYYILRVDACEAQVYLAAGNIPAAVRWADESGLSTKDEMGLSMGTIYLILARILIAQERLDEALATLHQILEWAEPVGAVTAVVRARILQAQALQMQDKTDAALESLRGAVDLGQPEGFVHSFIQEGDWIRGLLRQLADGVSGMPYATELLGALGTEHMVSPSLPAGLVEPLSERELEVLRLLVTPMTQADIAQELYVSVNTARTHVKNIYGKLDAHSRLEAIEKARALGLL